MAGMTPRALASPVPSKPRLHTWMALWKAGDDFSLMRYSVSMATALRVLASSTMRSHCRGWSR